MAKYSQKRWVSAPLAQDKDLREFSATIQENLSDLWSYAHDHTAIGADVTVADANRVVVSDDDAVIESSDITTDELETLDGITSNIQSQIDGKQPIGSYITALTGDVTATGPGSVAATIVIATFVSSHIVTRETPSGLVNSSNTVYTLAFTPITGTECVFLNGVLMTSGVDYTISTVTITFSTAPATGDILRVSYIK